MSKTYKPKLDDRVLSPVKLNLLASSESITAGKVSENWLEHSFENLLHKKRAVISDDSDSTK